MDWMQGFDIFIKVAQTSNFSLAARALGINTAIVTKYIKWLETELKTTLFIRTTRRVNITESGAHLLSRLKPWLEEFNNMQLVLEDKNKKPEGNIVIGCPSNILNYSPLDNWLFDCISTFPSITYIVKPFIYPINLIEEGIDIFIGLDQFVLNKNEVVGKTLKHYHRACYASPQYLNTHKQIKKPEDLLHHNCLSYQDRAWELNNKLYYPSGNYISDTGTSMYCYASRGLGIIYAANIFAEQYLQKGELQRILPNYQSQNLELKIYYPKVPFQSNKSQSVIDHFVTMSK